MALDLHVGVSRKKRRTRGEETGIVNKERLVNVRYVIVKLGVLAQIQKKKKKLMGCMRIFWIADTEVFTGKETDDREKWRGDVRITFLWTIITLFNQILYYSLM